jgi:hypothetical protein
MPEALAAGSAPLVYLSLGSLGSADVGLMRKIVSSLTGDRYRVIVSKGPQAEQLELAGNMAGAEFLPQASILPKVDVVITHGGNNTVTESLYFGKPMVVLPLFWDQHDNAQRLDETGLGIRLDTYAHAPEELTAALDRLLADEPLALRLEVVELVAVLGARRRAFATVHQGLERLGQPAIAEVGPVLLGLPDVGDAEQAFAGEPRGVDDQSRRRVGPDVEPLCDRVVARRCALVFLDLELLDHHDSHRSSFVGCRGASPIGKADASGQRGPHRPSGG